MGREVGGEFRMGNTCTPMVDACWCMAKPIQYCKVNNKNNNKIEKQTNKKKIYYIVAKNSIFYLGNPSSLKIVALRD